MKQLHFKRKMNFTGSGIRLNPSFFILLLVLLSSVYIYRLPVHAQSTKEKQVLIIHPFASDYPAHTQFDKGVKEALMQNSQYRFSYSYEYMDSGRHSNDPGYWENMMQYLRAKYKYHQPDFILVDFNMLQVLEQYGQQVFPDIPIIMSWGADPIPGDGVSSKYIFIPQLTDIEPNIPLILATRPQTEKLYVVVGDSAAERQIVDHMRLLEENYGDQLEFAFLNKLPYSQMLEAVRRAEEDSAILFIRWAADVEGDSYIPEDVVRTIAQETNVPVYTVVKHFLEEGIVGGYVRDFEASGRAAARVVSGLLEGKAAAGQSAGDGVSSVYAFDWRQLQRWGVEESSLPKGSEILYRQFGIWERYGIYIGSGFAFMALQTLLIVALLIHRRRRKRAEQELIEANKVKDTFLVNTSHELQTPLNGIINISELLIEGRYGSLKQQQEEELKVVLAVSRRLSSLINDIIDMEKIKQNALRVDLAAIDLASAVSVALDVIRHVNEQSRVDIVVDIAQELSAVQADENRLIQVLLNLLGNAVKFTPMGSILVSAQEEKHCVKVMIEDTGIGIESEKQKALFEAFRQGDRNISVQYGGSGLGLHISRQLMERMGGQIRLEWSVPGKGSCFSIMLPKCDRESLHRLSAPVLGEAKDLPADGQMTKQVLVERFKVLAVDDEPTNLRVLQAVLASDGYEVITASNAHEAIERIRSRNDIDLVLMDVMMPGMSGYTACRKLRENYSLYDLPLIMLTVRNMPEDVEAGFSAGANDFIVKPFVAKELRVRVATVLQLKQTAQAAFKNEMAFLQAQIKPHFLYNSLSVITALSTKNPQRTKELLYDLSDYLRGSFNFENYDGVTPIESELATVRAYLSIEKERFQGKLSVAYDIDDSIDISVPLLTIQPLVENAIRHGIMKRPGNGTVSLSVQKGENYTVIAVRDDGVGIPRGRLSEILGEATSKAGVGLKNIQRRLILYYGQGLEIQSEEGQGTAVMVRIPD